ncbi:Hypothetical predicted protein [Olea europaea subsp. europaea]|uniref:Uncharacterized protein n=1 Tax=Olea europaea subsp. europaea TaxID=158383 RepID=A0A8S0TCU4_OLEEU|nr:Hypothetical predicted protein [Olea europaea subsp. europaea]
MKISSKPISSPSRAEKFSPPLMMFSRSNGSSRSRSRSRSRASPIFYFRNKKNAEVIETAQEPSSPKVTCIGQVRVRRSSKTSWPKKAGGATNQTRPCRLFKKILCRNCTSRFHKPKAFRRSFLKWDLFVRSGCCRKADTKEESFEVEPIQTSRKVQNHVGNNCEILGPQLQENEVDFLGSSNEILGAQIQENKRDFLDPSSSHVDNNHEIHEPQIQENKGNFLGSSSPHVVNKHEILEAQIQESKRDFLGSPSPHVDNNQELLGGQIQENKGIFLDYSSPPKIALLLTRSRSAPYRSSSLASRGWESPPLATPETEREAKIKNEFQEYQNPCCEHVAFESRNSREGEESEGSVNNVQKLSSTVEGVTVHPLLLTRCKSEPARTGERLMPEANLWRQRRSGGVKFSS